MVRPVNSLTPSSVLALPGVSSRGGRLVVGTFRDFSLCRYFDYPMVTPYSIHCWTGWILKILLSLLPRLKLELLLSRASFASSWDRLVDSLVFTAGENHGTMNLDMSCPWSMDSMFQRCYQW
ncbi:uncharacterized protein LOC127806082 [Diospyros lotus]|uniref:uncharacterized protein LOC127806082 n=1 Tax=Diospyros lotus TaxID=55363 RepID=UPI00224DF4C5|nr:uncharacterized protein LOC127806082 [Diospyros lotus]